MSSVKMINYGSLTDPEMDPAGNAYFGGGNTGLVGWHGQTYSYEASAFEKGLALMFGLPIQAPHLSDTVFAKVIYRQGEDAAPTNNSGRVYNVDGGTQQGGVHGAPADNADRASWNVHFSMFDYDGDFSGAQIKVDLDPTSKTNFLVFNYDAAADGFVAIDKNGNVRFLDDGAGNGSEVGDTAQDSINLLFFKDLIDQDGNARNGFQPWDLESGQFDFVFTQKIDRDLSNPFNTSISTRVTVNVGEAAEAPAPLSHADYAALDFGF